MHITVYNLSSLIPFQFFYYNTPFVFFIQNYINTYMYVVPYREFIILVHIYDTIIEIES